MYRSVAYVDDERKALGGMVDLNLVRFDHVAPAGFVAVTCARCWSQKRCMALASWLPESLLSPRLLTKRPAASTVRFQTARFQTAALLLLAPNVFALLAFIDKGTRGNNGA